MKRFLSSLVAPKSTKSPEATFAPRLDALGDRVVPAITSITQNLATGVATIVANGANDNITFTDNGSGSIVVTGAGLGAGGTALNAGIRKIELDTRGGDDVVRYLVNGNMARSIEFQAKLGNGDDEFSLIQHGSDVLSGVNQVFKVEGQSGRDSLRVGAAGETGNRVNIAQGGSMQLTLLGGSNLDLFDKGDTINVSYRGELDGTFRLKAEGGLGNDVMNALLTLEPGSTGQVTGFNGQKAVLAGDLGGDLIDFRVRNNGNASVSAEANAGLDLDADTVRHTANVSSVFAFGDGDQVVN